MVGKFGEDDRAALDLIEPSTPAYLYIEGSILIRESGQDAVNVSPQNVRKTDQGWTIAPGVVLSDFVVSPAGKIQSFARNGTSIDTIVAPGDGTEYTATPGEYDEWTGTILAKVHSFRRFDNNVFVLVTMKNDSTTGADVWLKNYVVDGRQFDSSVISDDTLPGVTRTTISSFENVAGGGKAYATLIPSNGQSTDLVIDVPALG